MMELQNFDTEVFLRDYWQQKPLLIRGAWPDWQNPLSPDDLAGLACEDEVESRLITLAKPKWKAEHGPLPETRFNRLGKNPWTLLVQAVDHYVPEVSDLIDAFRFIPNWRIDDVMVSTASDGGGVGPHFDHYDVFLIQGLGQRRWQIGGLCDDDTPLQNHDDLRLLANFVAEEEWLLGPGDMLYVPPRFAHNGVAVGDHCMTYSIGFRAPSRAELISNFCDSLLDGMDDDDRYTDPGLPAQTNPGEVSPAALARLHGMITATLTDPDAFARWFGQYTTRPKYAVDYSPEQELSEESLPIGAELICNPASRFAFVERGAGDITLFVDGDFYECSGTDALFAKRLCAGEPIEVAADIAGLIVLLLNKGSVAIG